MATSTSPSSSGPKKLWVGGTSSLTRTYFHAFVGGKSGKEKKRETADEWILLAADTEKPAWVPAETTFISCDLTTAWSDSENISALQSILQICRVNQIVVGIRPPLVALETYPKAWEYADAMLDGLETVLEAANEVTDVEQIVHVSSIAAVDHLEKQHLRSETDVPDPNSEDLVYPYDRFKRESEEIIERIAQEHILNYTHLRLGAIFSDSPTCIQHSFLSLQSRIAPYLPTLIDCNSARNASTLLHLVLKDPKRTLRPVYYYTRPLRLSAPVPYGDLLLDYRKANDISVFIWLPMWVMRVFLAVFHVMTGVFGNCVPYLQSLDYLLLVTKEEHTFDCSAVRKDFPKLEGKEESMLKYFRRRRQLEVDWFEQTLQLPKSKSE